MCGYLCVHEVNRSVYLFWVPGLLTLHSGFCQTQQISMLNEIVCLTEGTDPDFGRVYLIILSVPPHHCTKVLLLECAEY